MDEQQPLRKRKLFDSDNEEDILNMDVFAMLQQPSINEDIQFTTQEKKQCPKRKAFYSNSKEKIKLQPPTKRQRIHDIGLFSQNVTNSFNESIKPFMALQSKMALLEEEYKKSFITLGKQYNSITLEHFCSLIYNLKNKVENEFCHYTLSFKNAITEMDLCINDIDEFISSSEEITQLQLSFLNKKKSNIIEAKNNTKGQYFSLTKFQNDLNNFEEILANQNIPNKDEEMRLMKSFQWYLPNNCNRSPDQTKAILSNQNFKIFIKIISTFSKNCDESMIDLTLKSCSTKIEQEIEKRQFLEWRISNLNQLR